MSVTADGYATRTGAAGRPPEPGRPDAGPARLVAAAAAGDQRAWHTLVDRYGALVWSVARGYRLSDADAADVSQATWLRLVEKLDAIRDPASVGAWLATTARREALALIRQRRHEALPESEELDSADTDQPAPWWELLLAERDRELWQAFDRLPVRCQALLRLLVIENEGSYASVAATLDVPIGSLGPTRARCLTNLRALLRGFTREAGVG